jgi:hypothetical protein
LKRRRVEWYEFTNVTEVLRATIIRAVSEVVNSYQSTRRYNPEDSRLHTHRRENLKSYFCIKESLESTALHFSRIFLTS